jgi:uncharacterized protein YbjT (DUF2867 family)
MSLLVVGGTSRVGQVLAQSALTTRVVRVATRNPQSVAARRLRDAGAQIVAADLRNMASLQAACNGMETVVASAHGFPGTTGNDVQSVDLAGHRSLIKAAVASGVKRFIYISALGAGPDVPVDLFRAKWAIEQDLAASGLAWTTLRASAFMEFWAALVGQPILDQGRTTVFGRGTNPINFVSAGDVAHLALRLADDPEAVNRIVEIGGPENLTMLEVVARFERAAGRKARVRHIPLAVMRALRSTVGQVVKPLGRVIGAGILMDTTPMTFEPAPTLVRWPMELTTLDTVIARAMVK